MKKTFFILLTTILLCTSHAMATPFTDTAGIWCEDEIAICYEWGLLSGTSDSTFSPDNPLTNNQVKVITARLADILCGGDGVLPEPAEGEDWYQPALTYMETMSHEQGVASPFGTSTVNNIFSCQRQDFLSGIRWAIAVSGVEFPILNNVTVLPDSASPEDFELYNLGIVAGVDNYGTLDGGGTLTRGQAAAVLARVLEESQRMTFTLETFNALEALYKLDPKLVVFTIAGIDYTLEQFGDGLTSSGRVVPANATQEMYYAEGLAESLRQFPTTDVAPRILAEQLDLGLTPAEQAAITAQAESLVGCKGMTQGFWEWDLTTTVLMTRLYSYYEDLDDSLSDDLGAIGAMLSESMVVQPGYDQIHIPTARENYQQGNYPNPGLYVLVTPIVLDQVWQGTQSDDWGLYLWAEDVTATSATIHISQQGGTVEGALTYGAAWTLEQWDGAQWCGLEATTNAWITILYTLPMDETTTLSEDWSFLYGTLEPGTYRYLKSFTDDTGNYKTDESREYQAVFTVG